MYFDGYDGIPPQLTSSVLSVFDDYEVIPPQLPSTVLIVLKISGPPPKVLMVSETERLPPPLVIAMIFAANTCMSLRKLSKAEHIVSVFIEFCDLGSPLVSCHK